MCNQSTLRDREFDSLVEQSISAPDNAAQVQAAQAAPKPFSAINESFEAVRAAIRSGDFQAAQDAAQAGVKATLEPYYLGRGQFDHVRFLADLESEKGSKLDEFELRLFGRAVGEFTGGKLADEVNSGAISTSEGLLLALGVTA
jgi:hypothetical protein